jgi:hypothetical protein
MLVMLAGSSVGNMMLAHKVAQLEANPVVQTQFKEIEVIKKAMCECGHPSSMHLAENTSSPIDGGCQQEFFELQGKKTTSSFKCFCVKYVGPEPLLDYFDARVRQLETQKIKELG